LLGLGGGAGGILGRDGTFMTVEAPRSDLDLDELFPITLITAFLLSLYDISGIISSLSLWPGIYVVGRYHQEDHADDKDPQTKVDDNSLPDIISWPVILTGIFRWPIIAFCYLRGRV
jgi:hypothetical protein